MNTKTRTERGTEHHAHHQPELHPNARIRIDGTDGSNYAVSDDVTPMPADEILPSDYGPQHDFEVADHGSLVVIFAESTAATKWLYQHLPEDCPRWGANGFAIERRFVAPILEHMDRDGLMSRAEFDAAMAEQQDMLRQWS